MPQITTFFPRHAVVTPDDDNDLVATSVLVVYNSDGGTINVVDPYDNEAAYPIVGNEALIPVQVKRITATGTSGINGVIMAHW